MKSSIEIVADFICPFEDNLNMIFIGDNLDSDIKDLFIKFITKSRKSLPDKLNPVVFNSIKTTDLFRGKHSNIVKN